MTPPLTIKICGLTSEAAVEAVSREGAEMAGFMFFARSPRNVSLARATELAQGLDAAVQRVAVMVNPEDADIGPVVDVLEPDILQLHGSEPPERVAEVAARFGVPVMKVLSVAGPEDVARARDYEGVAARLLFDAKPPTSVPDGRDRPLPGGNALKFDWELLQEARFTLPWMLAGGLDADNVAEAIRISGAPGVDVSSGVESAPGVKDPAKVTRFIRAARAAHAKETT